MQAANLGFFFPGISGRLPTTPSMMFGPLKCHKDNWMELMAINHLCRRLQASTGITKQKSGYDGLVEVVEMAYLKFHPTQQTQLVLSLLNSLLPSSFLHLIKSVLPKSRLTRELFAGFTTFFFTWLVGPCRVGEREGRGGRERSMVVIKKCRFLEQSKCVGMCINLCKLPTQEFIREKLGMPITMLPDFDDMSCRIVFGESPPSQDPTLVHPCLSLCKAKVKKIHHVKKLVL